MRYIIILVALFVMSVSEPPMYRAVVVSGVECQEDGATGTNTGRQLSYGNGDVDTYAVMPFDGEIFALSVTTQLSCGGTASITIDTNGVNVTSKPVSHTGTNGSYEVFDPPIEVSAGTRISARRTTGCSSGGDGMVACWYWKATLPDSIIYN